MDCRDNYLYSLRSGRTSLKRILASMLMIVVLMAVFFQQLKVSAIIGNAAIQFIVLAFPLSIFALFTSKKLSLQSADLWLFAYVLMCITDGLVRTRYVKETFEYWIYLLIFFIFKLVIQSDIYVLRKVIKWFYRCAKFMVVMIFAQVLFGDYINSFMRLLLSRESYSVMMYMQGRKYMTGLAVQPASAVWYCAILLAFAFARVYNKRKLKLQQILLVAFAFFVMLFTQKRSVLFASIITAYCMYFIFSRKKNMRVCRLLVVSFIFLVIAIAAYTVIPQLRYMLEKTMEGT